MAVLTPLTATMRGLAAAAMMICAVGCNSSRPSANTNVVLISIDSLRADHVGAYGYTRPTTPTIDALATKGVVFTRAYSSSSWTLPAHAALLTGLADSAHGATSQGKTLRSSASTLAELLRAAGYATTGFYSGPFLHPHFGLDQGFQRYIDCSSYGLGSRKLKPLRAHAASHDDITNPNILRKLSTELSRRHSRPFFFFIHMWDVHYDLIPPPPFDTMFDDGYSGSFPAYHFRHERGFRKGMNQADYARVLALYDGEIRSTDTTIAAILGKLRELSLLNDTLIVITADHGEEFLEHDGKGHRRTLFEEVTRVPLLMWLPGKLDPRRIDDAVALIDIAPTILDVVGLQAPPEMMGRSLVALAHGERGAEPYPVLSELFTPTKRPALSALVLGHDKLIVDHRSDSAWYYDLSADSRELHPYPAESEPRARALAVAMQGIKTRAQAIARRHQGLDQEADAILPKPISDQLRSLGYLQ